MRARASIFLIHLMGFLKVSLGTIGSAEISNRRPPRGNRFPQDALHSLVESVTGGFPKSMAFGIWVNVGSEQDFIRINIANARQAMLVEKQGFQLATSGLNKSTKVILRDRQGIGSESALYEGF